MKPALFCAAIAFAFCSFATGQATEKKLSAEVIKAFVAKCKVRVLKQPNISLPENWIGKNEKMRLCPVVSYTLSEDGSIHDVKLVQSSGVKKLDEYAVRLTREAKYAPMPGCPGLESNACLLIHFR